MSFLKKIFRKSEKGEKKEAKEAVSPARKEIVAVVPERKKQFGQTGVLSHPHVTEKTSGAAARNQYAFVVSRDANKIMVRRAVEERYGVSVASVNISNMPGKERKRGRQIGWRQGFKKAIVSIKKGQKIDIQ